MDVKGGVHNLGELEEVGISCVGQHRFQRYPSEGWRIQQESKAGMKERNHRHPQRPSCSPAQSALACCLRR